MFTDTLYFILSFSVVVVSVLAVIAVKYAINRGLTHEAIVATSWALGFVAIGRLWHTTYEILKLDDVWGHDSVEMLEYVLYLIGYFVFLVLVYRAGRVITK